MNHYYYHSIRLIAGILCLCCFPTIFLHAQISEGGLPPSFQFMTNLKSTEQPVQIPVSFSVEDLKVVDAWRVSQGAPLAIAKRIETDLSISNSGNWGTLPDGQKVWQLHLEAKGAIALILSYSDFYIPEGGKLFIYNADKSQVLGAYTTRTHPQNGHFATEPIAGDEITLEYVPAASGEEPLLRISGIGYGYNHLYVTKGTKSAQEELSGPCMVNINCEEGDDWQLQQKGVCHTIQLIKGQYFICSGSLVNNTAKDKKPYILTAYHCSQTMDGLGEATDEELQEWMFFFHMERTGCDNSSSGNRYEPIVGCTRKAAIPIQNGSDGLLLLLNENIPDNYDVFFNGWDRTGTPSPSGVGIHHPSGDYKKISTYGKYPVESVTWSNADTKQTGARNAHWNTTFDETANGHAVTEGGSSGSPLFNNKGLIIGTLSGGNSSCENPNGLNLYGKFSFHWNKFSENTKERMDIWLDPQNTGTTYLAGMSQDGQTVEAGLMAPTDLTARKTTDGNIELEWKAPIYQQIIGWGDQGIVSQFGLGDPFYYGQRWDTNDLTPIHKKTITTVYFTPVENVSYAVYIEQGNRIYEEDLTDIEYQKTNAITLKKPFTIDAGQDLIVAIHAKEYNKKIFPAFADEGPAIDGKGNIYAMSDKKWATFPTEELDANSCISFVVTSKEGELTNSASLLSAKKQALNPVKSTKMTIIRSEIASSSPEGFLITDFTEPTGYQINRDQLELVTLPASSTQYTDKNIPANAPVYQVYALYNDKKSQPVTIDTDTSVDNEQIQREEEVSIQPNLFSDQVNIIHNQQVKLLEIYASNGKLVKKIQHPGSIIHTGSLPQGVYFFRMTTDRTTKTIQGIRK